MASKYAYRIENLKTMFERPYELKLPAVRVFGNLYFVGNQDGASWLVETEEGLLLFDTNYPTADALLLDSIWSLGFDPRKIVAIFHTHGHFDHFGATDLIKNLSGAKTYLGIEDARMFRERPQLAMIQDSREAWLEIFTPDVEVKDGDIFTFGSTTVRAMAAPGHSQGATHYFISVSDGKQTLVAGLNGGAGLNTLCVDFREQYQLDWRKEFLETINRSLEETADIFLGNHTGQNHAQEKIQRLQEDPMAFVDPNEWTAFHEDLKQRFLTMCAEEQEEANGNPAV